MRFQHKILFVFLLIFPFVSFSQYTIDDEEDESFWDRVYFGGGLGLQFGNYTLVDVSPRIGYKITDEWSIGLSSKYQYIRIKTNNADFETNTYGGGVFSSYFFADNLFAHAEYEVMNGKWAFYRDRFNLESLLVGGGYKVDLGGRAFSTIMILVNLIDSEFTPYRSPIIRVNFGVGL